MAVAAYNDRKVAEFATSGLVKFKAPPVVYAALDTTRIICAKRLEAALLSAFSSDFFLVPGHVGILK
jgi:hypothetical protein